MKDFLRSGLVLALGVVSLIAGGLLEATRLPGGVTLIAVGFIFVVVAFLAPQMRGPFRLKGVGVELKGTLVDAPELRRSTPKRKGDNGVLELHVNSMAVSSESGFDIVPAYLKGLRDRQDYFTLTIEGEAFSTLTHLATTLNRSPAEVIALGLAFLDAADGKSVFVCDDNTGESLRVEYRIS